MWANSVMTFHRSSTPGPPMVRSKVPNASLQKTSLSDFDELATLEPDRTFPFMKLPPELRNNVYEKVIENSPTAFPTSRTRGRLACGSALPRVSREIRNEFLPVMYDCSQEVRAAVKDLNFAHVVTFLNRLSERELSTFRSTAEASPSRKMVVELVDLDDRYQVLVATGLQRWVNRMYDKAKKGTDIEFEYIVTEIVGSRKSTLRSICRNLESYPLYRGKGKAAEEYRKIVHAVKLAPK